jgi:hypothetical protein
MIAAMLKWCRGVQGCRLPRTKRTGPPKPQRVCCTLLALSLTHILASNIAAKS